MDFNEEEDFLLETEVAVSIGYDDLINYRYCPGKVFYKKLRGKAVPLLNPGQFMDHESLEKFREAKDKIQIEKVVSTSNIHRLENILTVFLESPGERERVEAREAFIELMKELYVESNVMVSPLDLVIACDRVFYKLSDALTDYLSSSSTELYERSGLVGAMAVVFSILFGYCEGAFLQDIFHLSFLCDLPLLQNGGVLFERPLEQIRRGGLVKIQEENLFVVPAHKEVFTSHISGTVAEIQKLDVLNDNELAWLADRHHENLRGTGFPNRLDQENVSDIESIFMFLWSVIPYRRPVYEVMKQDYLRVLLKEGKVQLSPRMANMADYILDIIDFEEEEEDDDIL